MNIDFKEAELAILNDALRHIESTTDVYEYIGSNPTREAYRKAFTDTFDKIKRFSSEKAKQGAFYFETD